MVVILVMENFCGCDFDHGKFFGHVILVMGKFFWTCDFGHRKFFFDHVETLNETSLEFT